MKSFVETLSLTLTGLACLGLGWTGVLIIRTHDQRVSDMPGRYRIEEPIARPATELPESAQSFQSPAPQQSTERRKTESHILSRPNDYGNGASVPIAPIPQDVRARYDSAGRYAPVPPSPRTTDHR